MLQVLKKFPNKILLNLMLTSSLLVIAVSAFRWSLMDMLTPFLEPLLELVLFWFFLIVSIWALFYFLLRYRKIGHMAGIPLVVSLTTFFILLVVPFTNIALEIDWITKYSDRVKVVEMIQKGEYDHAITDAGDPGKILRLPEGYQHVSKDGVIIIQRNQHRLVVFFYTFRGVMGHFSGYAYVSDNLGLLTHELGGRFKQTKKMEDNWFWGASY